MPNWLIGKMLSPFFMLLLIWLVTRPCRRAIERHLPEGRLKRLLMRRIS